MTGILNLLASGKPPAAAVTAYQIERSLRFNAGDNASLNRTPAVAGNRMTWTWSGWVKLSKLSPFTMLFKAGSGSGILNYIKIGILDSSGKLRIDDNNNIIAQSNAVFRDFSAWYHFVFVLDTTQATASNRFKAYANGSQLTWETDAIGTYFTQNSTPAINNNVIHTIGSEGTNYDLNAYVADVHFIDGQALTPAAFGAISATTGVWTPSAYTGTYGTNGFRLPFNDNSSVLNLGCNTAQTGDELWPYTTLHLSGNPANTSGYNCFSDKSGQNNGNGFPITVNGDTRSSSFSPYNTNYSAYFDNTNDYISYNTSDANLAIAATDNFCVECWVYYDTAPNYEAWFQAEYRTGALTSNCMWFGYNSGSIVLGRHASTNFTSATQTFNQGQWYHLVGVRQAGNVAIFVNGTRVANASSNTMDAAQNGFNIGNIYPGGYMGGYISNVRYIRSASGSTMPYDPTQTTISVPTTQLTAVTGTRVLACQGNRFLDASSNNYTLTVNDAPRITNFGPFLETDTTSGSGYFDGTSDSLTVSSNVVSATGAFTIEAWIFPTSSTANQCIIAQYSGNAGRWQILFNAAGKFELSGASTYLATTGTYTAINVWYHVVFQRDISNNLSVYINGKRDGTANNAISLETTATYIGDRNTGGTPFFGYISDLKVSNTVSYSGTDITVPTTKANSTASTTLLTLQDRANYNNSGFQDSSGNNHIITRPSGANVTQGSFSPFSNSGWSNYFDGTGDFLTWSPGNSVQFGTGDFTIETWIYPTAALDGQYIIDGRNSGQTAAFAFLFGATGTGRLAFFDGSTVIVDEPTASINANQWTHCCVVRSGSTVSLFINGVRRGVNSSYSGNISTAPTLSYIGKRYAPVGGLNFEFSGYISCLRIVKGTAVYDPTQTILTVPTLPLTTISGTQLLTCQSNRFIDLSSNNFTITTNGDTKVVAFSPFTSQSTAPTSYSAYFDGTSDYLTTTVTGGINSTTFSVEFWAYFTVLNSASPYYVFNLSGGSGQLLMGKNDPGFPARCLFQDDSGATVFNLQGGTINANQWMHFACVKNGANVSLWLDGTRVATTSSATVSPTFTATSLLLGGLNTSVALVNGYVSNFRLVSGSTAYDTSLPSIPVPTAPLNPISGTKLLTLQSNRLVDASTNNATITRTGDVVPREFNPFGNTVTTMAYSPTVHGGSGYFDGTGDYLNLASSDAFNISSGDFTIETWVYRSSTQASTYPRILTIGNANYSALILWTSGNTITVDVSTNGSSWTNWTFGGATITNDTWTHLALVRNAGTISLYKDGVSQGTPVSNSSFQLATPAIYVGTLFSPASNYWTGYIGSTRIVKGTAVYTGNFTPPSGPVTAIPGTSLLLNFTNAGIVDYTGKNVLETLGNASNVTALKKSLISAKGSLYFDGTSDYLTLPSNNLVSLGTADFTVEFWVNYASATAYTTVIISNWFIEFSNTRGLVFYDGATGHTRSYTVATSQWYHVAVSKQGTNLRFFVDGVQQGATVTSFTYNITNASILEVGRGQGGSYPVNGYLQDLRITKYARYTGTFTPPVRTFAHNVLDIGHKQWTPVNFSVASGAGNDSLVDTPTPYGIDAPVAGSYATWSNGSLTLSTSTVNATASTISKSSGKWYWEVTPTVLGGSSAASLRIGVCNTSGINADLGGSGNGWCFLGDGRIYNGGVASFYGTAIGANDVLNVALDIDAGKIWYGKNGTWMASGNPVTGANASQTFTAGQMMFAAVASGIGTPTYVANFGASTFAYTPPAGFAGLQDFVSGGVVRGNYCTLNPLSNSGSAPTNGGLTKPGGDGVYTRCNSTMAVSTGKWYFETVFTTTGTVTQVGIGQGFITNKYIGEDSLSYSRNLEDGNTSNNSVSSGNSATYAAGDIFMCAIDLDNNKLWFGKNGVWINTGANPAGNPAAGTNPAYNITPGTYSVATRVYGSGSLDFNFGQRPFNYTAPSGFKALCTQNLSTPSIVKSNTAFDALVWSGDGVNNRKLTTNFSPDLFWVKARNSAAYHSINDSVRGANAILQTNTTSAEQVNSNGYVTTFAADGVNITNGSDINASGTNYVGWAWDAGTTTVTNTAGTISAQVRANPTTGFSIVSYTGVAGGNSVGHGLGVAPKFIIVKGRTTSAWIVYTQMTGVNAYLYLHTSGASVSDVGIWSGTGSGVTSSTFGVRGASDNGLTGVNLIAYCFAEVPGFSSFGQWTGNGSADGPFIYTDFKPAVVIAKQTNTSGQNWYILNNESSTYNVVNRRLYPNLSLDESADGNINCDFVSNGFKLRDAYTGWNASGGTYIYAAFAENPFKYSLAR